MYESLCSKKKKKNGCDTHDYMGYVLLITYFFFMVYVFILFLRQVSYVGLRKDMLEFGQMKCPVTECCQEVHTC